jgi:hypothetical protein
MKEKRENDRGMGSPFSDMLHTSQKMEHERGREAGKGRGAPLSDLLNVY